MCPVFFSILAGEMRSKAEVESHGPEGLHPIRCLLRVFIGAHQEEAPVLFIPDPAVFNKPDALFLQPDPEIFPDLFPLIKRQPPVGRPHD